MVGSSVSNKSGMLEETKDKRFCVPENLTAASMELIIKMKMGQDLAVFPQDRSMPAVSFVGAVVAQEYGCHNSK